jgi:hypothetical protein
MRREALLLPLAFIVGAGVAGLLGAVSLGVAFGVGQLCFAAAVVWLILRS